MTRSVFAVKVTHTSADSAWTFSVIDLLSERQVLRSRHSEFSPVDRIMFYAPVPFTQFSAEWRQSLLAKHLQQLRQSLRSLPVDAVQASKVYAIFAQEATPPIVWLTQPDAQRLRDAGWISTLAPRCWDAGFLLQQVPEHRFTDHGVLCDTEQFPASPSRFGLRAIPWLNILAQTTAQLPEAQAQELTGCLTAQRPWTLRTPTTRRFGQALVGYLARLQDCDAPWPTGWPDHVATFVHLLYATNAAVAETLFFAALFPDWAHPAVPHSRLGKES